MRFFLILTTLIASLNSNAQDFLWAQAFSPAPILSENTVAVDNASNVFFSTTFSYCIDADPGPGVDSFFAIQRVESFIAKLDQSGNYIWGKELDCGSTSDRNYVKDMAVDASGNVYAVGGYRGTIDFDPGNSVLNVSSGLYNDMFILKLDPAGNLVWVKTIGGSNHDSACAIKIDNSGNLLITGTFRDTVDFDPGAGAYVLISSGQSDVFFLKLDPNGDHIWSRREGSALNNDLAGSLDVDNIGNIYGLVSGGQQVSFSKMASNGAVVWTQQLTNPFNSNFAAEYIATDNAGNLCITGIFEFTTIDFDPGPGTFNMSYSDGSMFILKLDTSGT
ncbi:MAG TPA: hypothetical protein VEB40_01840, partial [Flavipsychrobacter sp.]|nr:hypothetical protein [Flavipsychrobacter sp.]